MKKHLSLLVPLLALFLAFAPQSARAEVGNIDDYLIQPFTIEFASSDYQQYLSIYTNNTYNATVVTIDLEYRMATDDGDFGAWTRLATKGITTSSQLYNATQTAFTLAASHSYKIQLRGNNSEGFCKKTTDNTDNYQILPQCRTASSKVKMYGNIMSLIKGFDTDNLSVAQEVLRNADEIPNPYCFYMLFYGQNLHRGTPSVYPAPFLDASNLIFPATKLKSYCYMNLFNEYYGHSGATGGLIDGPTFLATDFVDENGEVTTDAFRSAFLNCSYLTSIRVNFNTCPANASANLAYWLQGTKEALSSSSYYANKLVFAPDAFLNCANNNIPCETDGFKNSKMFSFSYPYATPTPSPAGADAKEALTANTKKILYPLTPTTINGITYTPVDMGYGVAWADRNVGAATTDAIGDYFMWGRSDARTTGGVGSGISYKLTAYGLTQSGDVLPYSADMATINIGANWRMPTQADLVELHESTTQTGRTFTNKADDSKSITIPASGYMYSGTSTQSQTEGQFWSSELDYVETSTTSYWDSKAKGLSISNGNVSYTQTKIQCAMPVRAVYDPSVLDPTFKTHTLRIITGDYHYDFICQHGQTVTITAVPDYENCKAFRYWDDNHSNTTAERTFTVNDDATYTAVFWSDPNADQYTATFYAADGETILDQDSYCEGQYIVYDGTTPVIAGYEFTGFSGFTAGTTQMGKTNVSFTAQYVQVFSLNATGRAGFTFTADGYDTNTTGTGIYHSGTVVSVAVAPVSAFERWSDGNTDNPRIVTLTANTTLTAQMADLESDDAAVDIYENLASNKCIIVHELTPTTAGGITYTPIDMGYGVAWADRNVGATSEEGLGGWYRWGSTTPETDQTATTNAGNTNMAATLTNNQDAAYQKMGSNWRMPSKAEFEALYNNTNLSDNKIFTSKSDEDNHILLPAYGYFITYSYYESSSSKSYQYYWTKEKPNRNNACYALIRYKNNTYGVYEWDRVSKTSWNTSYANNSQCHMQIRAIYQPTYTTYTLTINVGNKKYQYVCQEGQQVTVTAHATTSGYSFNEWTEDSSKANPRSFIVTGDMSYTATFAEAPTTNYYDITISTDPASGYGTVDVSSIDDVEEGTAITTSSNTLTIGATTITATPAESNAQYTYTFAGWTDDSGNNLPATLTGGLAVVAHFTRTTNTYTVTWKDEDGTTILKTDASVAYGTTPEYTGDAPTKASDLIYSYTFSGWNDGTTTYATGTNLPEVAGDVTYTAVYTSADLATFTLEEDRNENDPYYGVLTQLVGKKRTVTYNRSMGADKWHVVSLPFEFNLVTHPGHPFSGNIYEMTGATYNDGYLDFNFMPMTTTMKANKPYIFYSGTPAENVVFEDVTFVDLARYTGEGSNVLISAGSVDFINTTYRKALNEENKPNKHIVYIYSNKLYYPNNNVIWMRAFRGYFYLNMPDGAIQHIRPRVLIVSGAGTATAIEASSEEETVSVKKYVENGILVIERNGVKYDAQGAKIE